MDKVVVFVRSGGGGRIQAGDPKLQRREVVKPRGGNFNEEGSSWQKQRLLGATQMAARNLAHTLPLGEQTTVPVNMSLVIIC